MSKHTEENEDVIVDVQEVYSKTETFIENNKKALSGIILAVIVIVGGFFGYKKLVFILL